MKILICTPEYPPKASGIGIVVKSVVERMKERGHECQICSPTGPDLKLGSQVLIEKTGGIGLIYFWECVRRHFKNNYTFDSIWLHHPFFLFGNPFSNSLVTMHTTYTGFSKRSKISGHNPGIRIYYSFMNMIEKYSLTTCIRYDSRFTAISQTVVEELRKYGIRSEIIIIPNGTDTGKFNIRKDKNDLRQALNIPKNKIVFLWVGRLIEEKRPDILIKLFSIFKQKSGNFFLIIVGYGKLYEKLKKNAEDAGLDNILFTGKKDHSELPEIYACSDHYIITSIYEGQPLTLLEALSSGLPSIVSDIPNLKFVEAAECGTVIHFSDIEKAVQKIIDYTKKDYIKYAMNARKYAEENLDWEIITGRYLEELKTCRGYKK